MTGPGDGTGGSGGGSGRGSGDDGDDGDGARGGSGEGGEGGEGGERDGEEYGCDNCGTRFARAEATRTETIGGLDPANWQTLCCPACGARVKTVYVGRE